MKVAFFVHCFFPEHFYGTETYTLDLAKHYQAAGHDVVVVSAVFQGEPRREELVTKYVHQGIPVVCIDKNRIPHTRVKETYYQPDMRPVLERVLREIKPDVVHVTHLINHTAAGYCHLRYLYGFFWILSEQQAGDGQWRPVRRAVLVTYQLYGLPP